MTSKGIIKGVFYTVSIIIIIMSIAVLTTIPAGGVAGIIIGFILLFGIRRALRGLGYHSLARRLV